MLPIRLIRRLEHFAPLELGHRIRVVSINIGLLRS